MRVLPESCLGSRGPVGWGARKGRVLSERKAPCPHGKQVCRRASQKRQATNRQVPGERRQCIPAHPRVPQSQGCTWWGNRPPARQHCRHGTHTPLSVCKPPSGRRRVRGDPVSVSPPARTPVALSVESRTCRDLVLSSPCSGSCRGPSPRTHPVSVCHTCPAPPVCGAPACSASPQVVSTSS